MKRCYLVAAFVIVGSARLFAADDQITWIPSGFQLLPNAQGQVARVAAQGDSAEPSKPAAPAAAQVVVSAGRRVALVIGNSEYRSVPALANPGRDSEAVADALRQVGFQSVTLVNDATRDSMIGELRAFATAADTADWALIYYAGHGMEVEGLNYLIPVDAKLASDRDVPLETVSLGQFISSVDGAKKLRLVLLDANRNNPFANTMKRSAASSSSGRGSERVKPGAGMLVAFAAKHGQIALDGDGQNSPFASAFVKHVATPQIEINKLFIFVRDEVLATTKGRQEPFTYGSLPGGEKFYFVTTQAAGKP